MGRFISVGVHLVKSSRMTAATCLWNPPSTGAAPSCFWSVDIVVDLKGLRKLVWHQEESNNHNHVCVTAQPLFGVCLAAAPQCCVRAIHCYPEPAVTVITGDITPTYSWTWPIMTYTSFILGTLCNRCTSSVYFWIPTSLWLCYHILPFL